MTTKTNSLPAFRSSKTQVIKAPSSKEPESLSFRSCGAPIARIDNTKQSYIEESCNPNSAPINSVNSPSIPPDTVKKVSKIDAYELSQLLLQEHTFAIINNILHIYIPEYGYFLYLSEESFDMKIRQLIPDNIRRYITSSLLSETHKWLKSNMSLVITDDMLSANKNYFNFRNCMVNVNELHIITHSPSTYCTSYINADLPKSQTLKCPNFLYFLDQVTNSSKSLKLLLQEVTGYALSNNRSLKRLGILIGPSNSGKSTYLNLLQHLVGREFYSNLSLHDINTTFRLSLMVNKKLNTCAEMDEDGLKRLSKIKMLSGNDTVIVEKKGVNPFSFENSAFMLFSGNHLPALDVKDYQNAFLQRILFIPFPISIPLEEQDTGLLPKLLQESSSIASWALQGYLRLKSNNFIFTQGEETEAMYKQFLNPDPNAVDTFIENCCALDGTSRISTTDLHECYSDFCLHQKVKPLSQAKFTNFINTNYPMEYKKIRQGSITTYGFIGIRLRTNFDEYLSFE